MEETMVEESMEESEEDAYEYEDLFDAAKDVVEALFDEQTPGEFQEVFALGKEVYQEGSKAVSSMAVKVEAIGKVLIAMAQRIWGGTRAVGDTPFDRVVTRAINTL